VTVQAVSPLTPGDPGVRPLVFAPARTRTGRAGVSAIASIGALRPVEANPDATRYAEALTTATTYAADARRAAWVEPAAGSPFPGARDAESALASLLRAQRAEHAADTGAASAARNVTPIADQDEAAPAEPVRGTATGPGRGTYAAASQTYRHVASLVA
jgi:hypothetical protein